MKYWKWAGIKKDHRMLNDLIYVEINVCYVRSDLKTWLPINKKYHEYLKHLDLGMQGQ